MLPTAMRKPAVDLPLVSPWRSDFPALARPMHGQKLAYLDSAASALKPQAVIDAMSALMAGPYANIHRGLYALSQDTTAAFEAVRGKVAQFIGAAGPETIVFTRNTTESINLFAQSWARVHCVAGDEIVLTAMEHHANLVPWHLLQAQTGIVLKFIPVRDDGALDVSALDALITPRTKLVSVVHISNALGIINPVADIFKTARALNPAITCFLDASQSVVHGPLDVAALGCDACAFTGHKLYGPTGVGVLYARPDILESMAPYQGGGDMIEQVSLARSTYKSGPARFEAGTPAIIEVIGLGAAIDYMERIGWPAITAHEAALSDALFARLSERADIQIVGTHAVRVGIVSFNLRGAHASDVGMILDQCGVAVRTGHHCCQPLMARFGVDATVRASIGLYTDMSDIDALMAGLDKAARLCGEGMT